MGEQGPINYHTKSAGDPLEFMAPIGVVGKTSSVTYNKIKEGKVRDIYETGTGTLIIVSTDRISAFDEISPTLIPHKGVSLNDLSEYWLKSTKHIVPNHFIKKVDERAMEVRKADRIDIEWIMRGYIYGSAWRAYQKGERVICGVKLPDGLQMAEKLPEPILTITTKSDEGDKDLTKQEAVEKGLTTKEEFETAEEATRRLYDHYTTTLLQKGIIIPDFKVEIGRCEGELIQIDEPPTHDSARFWAQKFYQVGQKQEGHCLDKEFLRAYLMADDYQKGQPLPELPYRLVREISKRCVGSVRIIAEGQTFDEFNTELGPNTVEQVLKEVRRQSGTGIK